MENITVDELLKKLDNINIEIDKNSEELNKKNEILSNIKTGLEKIDAEIIELKPYVLNAIKLCDEINSELKRHRKVDKLLEKLSESDIKILNISKVNEFLGVTMQRVIKSITEGFEFEDSNYDKSILGSFKLYEAMRESIDYNHYIISRALIKINKELRVKNN